LVSLDPPQDLLLHLLLCLDHAHLSDILSASVVHQNDEIVHVRISLPQDTNSGDQFIDHRSTSTLHTLPPDLPHRPEPSGKTAASQIPSPGRSSARPEHTCHDA
jgi:hypothetical protein